MAGSKRERPADSGRWELRVFDGRDPRTGKPRQVSRIVHGTEKQADKALSRLVTEVADRRHGGATMTVAALLDRYLDFIEPRCSPSTMVHYRRRVEVAIKPALGSRRLGRLRASDLDDFYQALGQAGRSASDVRQYHAILRGALTQATKWGWLDRNPALVASPPRQTRGEVHPPTEQVARLLVAKADEWNPAFGMFLRLAVATGARRGELCALTWLDLDPTTAVLTIRRSVVDGLGRGVQPIVKDTKTHAARRVALDGSTFAALAAHGRAQTELAEQEGEKVTPASFMFSHDLDGRRPWRPEYATLAFRRLRGDTPIRLHDLRHLHASVLLAEGIPVRDVAERLGHNPHNASMTLGVYGHATSEQDRRAAITAGRILSPEK